MPTVTGLFTTRRQVELAVEHCVQEYGIERSSISIKAHDDENSAGTVIAGADAESGHPGTDKQGSPALHGLVEVSVDVDDDQVGAVRSSFTDAGARDIVSN